jgi:hypothetical protein
LQCGFVRANFSLAMGFLWAVPELKSAVQLSAFRQLGKSQARRR